MLLRDQVLTPPQAGAWDPPDAPTASGPRTWKKRAVPGDPGAEGRSGDERRSRQKECLHTGRRLYGAATSHFRRAVVSSRGRAPISNCGYDRAANEIDLVKLSI